MKTINAYFRPMSALLAYAAVTGTGKKPESVRMHSAQVCAIAMLFHVVAIENVKDLTSLEDIENVKRLASEYAPITFMGMKIETDDTMEKSWIDFLDEKGEVVARIVSLAIPNGFSE